MKLRGGRMLFDAEHPSYLFVRLFLEHVEVEHRTATIGKLGHERQQLFFGKSASGIGKIRNFGQLLFVYYQPGDPLPAPQVIERLGDHYAGNPCAERRVATKRKVGKYLDETVVQYIIRRVHIARVAVTHRQHLFGIESIKFPAGGIFSCPATLYQFYLVFQCNCLLKSNVCLRRLSIRRKNAKNAAGKKVNSG